MNQLNIYLYSLFFRFSARFFVGAFLHIRPLWARVGVPSHYKDGETSRRGCLHGFIFPRLKRRTPLVLSSLNIEQTKVMLHRGEVCLLKAHRISRSYCFLLQREGLVWGLSQVLTPYYRLFQLQEVLYPTDYRMVSSQAFLRVAAFPFLGSTGQAWKITWMEEPGRLQSVGSLRFGHD